jgi:hypothetical protein
MKYFGFPVGLGILRLQPTYAKSNGYYQNDDSKNQAVHMGRPPGFATSLNFGKKRDCL